MDPQQIVHIIEDDTSTRRLLENLTGLLGYNVISHDNGRDAWKAFEKKHPEIVISDWRMPGMDGLELCKALREKKADSYTYFMLVTAERRSKNNLERAIKAGVDDFLKKPISSEEIWNRIRVAQRILDFNHQVATLESLIPICAYCKSVRNDEDIWERIEEYVNERTGADFSHGICPDCLEKHVRPQMDEFKRSLETGTKAECRHDH